jgi:hypothetical protein
MVVENLYKEIEWIFVVGVWSNLLLGERIKMLVSAKVEMLKEIDVGHLTALLLVFNVIDVPESQKSG